MNCSLLDDEEYEDDIARMIPLRTANTQKSLLTSNSTKASGTSISWLEDIICAWSSSSPFDHWSGRSRHPWGFLSRHYDFISG
ncbi:unnamed protein product [Porites evermanni]|uniref:Uncharacterized protein n=1 Tax=Porites evermanni TaxID=104178 RepID=A0ABN8N7G7_9CNID|nr:unnamed protein product [Porites evermanni]